MENNEEILKLHSEGLTSEQISEKLNITVESVNEIINDSKKNPADEILASINSQFEEMRTTFLGQTKQIEALTKVTQTLTAKYLELVNNLNGTTTASADTGDSSHIASRIPANGSSVTKPGMLEQIAMLAPLIQAFKGGGDNQPSNQLLPIIEGLKLANTLEETASNKIDRYRKSMIGEMAVLMKAVMEIAKGIKTNDINIDKIVESTTPKVETEPEVIDTGEVHL